MFEGQSKLNDSVVPSKKPKACPARTQFGRNVSRLRRTAGLTQEELAERVNVSARYVQSLEAGEYFPTLPTLLKLRGALNAGWDELFYACRE